MLDRGCWMLELLLLTVSQLVTATTGAAMKLLRYGPPGQEQPGLLDLSGQIRSLSGIVDDIAGAALSRDTLARLRQLDVEALPGVDPPSRGGPDTASGLARLAGPTRIGPCV